MSPAQNTHLAGQSDALPICGFATSREVALYLRLSKSLVCKLIAEGKIPACRYGRAVRIPWAWLHEQAKGKARSE